ncbi:MAG: PD-(D/E)XK nuclease family protein [Magnetococcales bacterium]|nr:PD-(D/E)XK nuclease family protein [Magnetococcales bacterium]
MQIKELDLHLDDGWVVITVNRRLARYLGRVYEEQQRQKGKIIWPSPDILPLSAWLERSWKYLLDAAIPDKTVLTTRQEEIIWEQVVAKSNIHGSLLWTDSAAHGAQKAWTLLSSWSVDLQESDTVGNEDAMAFREWSKSFSDKCHDNKWLPKVGMIGFIADNLAKIPLPKGMVLAGFDEIPAKQKKLLGNLQNMGVPVVPWQPEESASNAVSISFPDKKSEITAAAHWARDIIENQIKDGAGSAPDKEISIGIIVPELQKSRGQILSAFSATFYPGQPQQSPFPEQSIFNLSLGAPLSEIPIIRDGLKLLELANGKNNWQEWGVILNSPFLGGGESEWSQRGLLDANIRNRGYVDLTIGDLIREGAGSCPVLHLKLSALQEFLAGEEFQDNFTQTPGKWANCFDQLLKVVGWPGEKKIDSQEFQVVESWGKVLGELAGLERVLPDITLNSALSELKQLVAATIFQPVENEAIIQILGVLEAEGESFDHLWVLGLSDNVWPKIPEPTPFIPIALQKKHNLPRSSSRRELSYAKRLTKRILASSNNIIVSYSRWEGEIQLHKSPLIESVKDVELKDILSTSYPDIGNIIMANAGMVAREEYSLPPLPDSSTLTGGTGVIKSQALCPFSAFAKYRLQAESLAEPTTGFAPWQRGEITHASLALFWQHVGDSQTLWGMGFAERESLVQRVAYKAVNLEAIKSGNSFAKEYLALEVQRQKRLLLTWLGVESSRDTQFTVVEHEAKSTIEVAGVKINFRIDRLDKLESGEFVVVDYKTGSASVANWFSDRPQEPQMLLYALANQNNLAALVYGQITASQQRYLGLAHSQGIIPAIDLLESGKYSPDHLDWQTLLDHWSTVVDHLAQQYKQGVVWVDPLPNACDWCDFPLLCRISEQQSGAIKDDDGGEVLS